MDPQALLTGVLGSAAVAAAILLVAWGLASRAARADAAAPAPAAALALGLAALAGFGLQYGWNFRPNESWRWLIWVFPALGLLGALEAREGAASLARWALRAAMAVLPVVLVLRKALWPAAGDLDLAKTALYLAVPLALTALWRAALPRLGPVAGAVALWMLASATAGMLVLAHCINFGQLGGAIAGGLGALIVACWLRPSASGMAGAIAPVAISLSTLVFLAFELADTGFSHGTFVLVALAPLLAWIPAKNPLVRLAWIALPLAVAVGIAFRAYDTSVF